MNIPTIKKLTHRKHFLTKIGKNFILAAAFLLFSLFIGILGYHYFMHLGFTDSLINASMILTGMGPVDRAETDAAKIFASLYAIYSGVAFLSSIAFLFMPIIHRFMHKLHLDIQEK